MALVAAGNAPRSLCGLILMATSGRPTGRLLIDQLRSNPANAPLMPEIEAVVADLEAGRSRDAASLSLALRPLFPDGLQRYMIDLFAYDPTAVARQWRGPALILQGDRDIQVKPADADLLAKAMPSAVRADLHGATHMLKMDVPRQPLATYQDPALPLHPDLVPAIVALLQRSPPAR